MDKNLVFSRVPNYDNFKFESSLIKGKNCRKKFVLLHVYLETGFVSIVAFADKQSVLFDIMHSHSRCGSNRHVFIVTNNCYGVFGDMTSVHPLLEGTTLNLVKDKCLLNICKNVAEYLAVGEYAMLKNSYFKSAAWFEKAKNSASLGADIIDNY